MSKKLNRLCAIISLIVRLNGFFPYKGQYIISAPTSDPLEGEMDPFYSVDMETGRFRDFPILLPENEFVFNTFCMEERR